MVGRRKSVGLQRMTVESALGDRRRVRMLARRQVGMRILACTRLCELVQLREINHDRIRVRTGDNPDRRMVGGRVDLLVHGVRRNENEISRARLGDVLQAVAPPVPGGPFKHIQDCFLIAVVVRTGRCAGSTVLRNAFSTLASGLRPSKATHRCSPGVCRVLSQSSPGRTTRTEGSCIADSLLLKTDR
jgi:hypothetical protein